MSKHVEYLDHNFTDVREMHTKDEVNLTHRWCKTCQCWILVWPPDRAQRLVEANKALRASK